MKIDDIAETVIMEIGYARDFFYELSDFLLELSVDERVPEEVQKQAKRFYLEL